MNDSKSVKTPDGSVITLKTANPKVITFKRHASTFLYLLGLIMTLWCLMFVAPSTMALVACLAFLTAYVLENSYRFDALGLVAVYLIQELENGKKNT